MSSTMRGALLVGLAALAVGGWWWWSGPERQIRRLLADVAAVLSHQDGRSALGGVTAAAGLHRHLDEAIVVEPGQPFEPITGRDAVIAAALRLQTPGQGMRVTFEDVRVAVAPDGATATVDATVTAQVGRPSGPSQVDAREVVLTVSLRDGRWVISHARAVPVLERMS